MKDEKNLKKIMMYSLAVTGIVFVVSVGKMTYGAQTRANNKKEPGTELVTPVTLSAAPTDEAE